MYKIIGSICGVMIGGWLMTINAQAATKSEVAVPRFQQVASGKWIDHQLPSVEKPGQFIIVASHNGHAVGKFGQWLINGQQVSAIVWLHQHQLKTTTASQRHAGIARQAERSTTVPVQLAARKTTAKPKTSETESNSAVTNDETAAPATSSQMPITDESLQSNTASSDETPQTAKAPVTNDFAKEDANPTTTQAASTASTNVAKLPQTSEYHGLLRVGGIITLTLTTSWWFIARKLRKV